MEAAAMRLAAVAALLTGGNQPYPTIAKEFVFDSVRDDILDIVPEARTPVIVVRTDEDQVAFTSHKPMKRQCRLIVEVSVVTSVQDKATGKSLISWPKTDTALEIMLNMMEWQVWNALMGKSVWALWFKNDMDYSANATGYTSLPRFTGRDIGAVRVACRTLEYLIQIPLECPIPALNELDAAEPPFLPPNICDVINYIIENGAGDFRTAVLGLGSMLKRYAAVTPSRHPALQRVWTQYPDYEIETRWPIEQAAALEMAPYVMGQATIGTPTIT